MPAEPDTYPDLPKLVTTPAAPAKAPVAPNATAKPTAPADRPATAPKQVTHGPSLAPATNVSGMAGLANAAVMPHPVTAARTATGAAAARSVVSKPSPTTATNARPGEGNKPGGLNAFRETFGAVVPSKTTDSDAQGRFGGLIRWDDLRERLRRDPYRLPLDDPLFAVIASMEELEAGLKNVVSRQREDTRELVSLLRETLDSVDPTRDLLEQSVNLQGDLLRLLEPLTRQFQEEVKALKEFRTAAPPPPAPVPEPVVEPVVAVAPEVKRKSWWSFLAKLWQR